MSSNRPCLDRPGVVLPSPAKINLFFRVLTQRADGYHEIASLYQAISLSDVLHLRLSSKDSFHCDHPDIPTNGSNLVLKAVELFRHKTRTQFHIAIDLTKHIPTKAGLGGGSSNAATTLYGLNALLGNPVTFHELQSWSADIGSDVPFFFSQGTAYCRGRGELVHTLPALPKEHVHIIKPAFGLATSAVYQGMQPESLSNRDPVAYLLAFQHGEHPCFNDLETSAFSLCPLLAELKTDMERSGFTAVVMSGSGTAMIGIGQGRKIANTNVDNYHCHFTRREGSGWYLPKGGKKAISASFSPAD